jgi:hypothetical protein
MALHVKSINTNSIEGQQAVGGSYADFVYTRELSII